MQCKALLDSKDIEVVPPYMIASKEIVKDFEKPKWTRKPNLPEVTKSWHAYQVKVLGLIGNIPMYYFFSNTRIILAGSYPRLSS